MSYCQFKQQTAVKTFSTIFNHPYPVALFAVCMLLFPHFPRSDSIYNLFKISQNCDGYLKPYLSEYLCQYVIS